MTNQLIIYHASNPRKGRKRGSTSVSLGTVKRACEETLCSLEACGAELSKEDKIYRAKLRHALNQLNTP